MLLTAAARIFQSWDNLHLCMHSPEHKALSMCPPHISSPFLCVCDVCRASIPQVWHRSACPPPLNASPCIPFQALTTTASSQAQLVLQLPPLVARQPEPRSGLAAAAATLAAAVAATLPPLSASTGTASPGRARTFSKSELRLTAAPSGEADVGPW